MVKEKTYKVVHNMEAKYKSLNNFINYCKTIKTKQKLYASFGKIYAIDLQDLHNKYELAKKQSSMVVEMDDVALNASALYTSILDFQTALYTKPTKNIKNCKKLFNILYSQKDNMFDEYDIIWYAFKKPDDKIMVVPAIYMVCETQLDPNNKELKGFVPRFYDFLSDQYYTLSNNPDNKQKNYVKNQKDLEAYYKQKEDAKFYEFYENLESIEQKCGTDFKKEIEEICPLANKYSYCWNKQQILGFAKVIEEKIKTEDKAEKVVLAK